MIPREYPHNTREQVLGYLDDAFAIVTELELDDELRVPAFVKAVDLLASKQVFYEQPGMVPDLAHLNERRQ